MDGQKIARFDGAAAWAGLTPEQQAEVGATALELCCSWYLQERGYDDDHEPWQILGDAAEPRCTDLLREAFVEAVERRALEDPEGAPLVPSLLGPVCRVCGCSHNAPCVTGCGWAEADLCTACAGVGVGSRGGAESAEVGKEMRCTR